MTIIIAHRLSTITRADRTYVIEGGRVVESGAHGNLISRNRFTRGSLDRAFSRRWALLGAVLLTNGGSPTFER